MIPYLVNSLGSCHITTRFPLTPSQVHQILEHEPDATADALLLDDLLHVLEVVLKRRQALNSSVQVLSC